MTTKTTLPRSNLPHPLPFHQRRWPPPPRPPPPLSLICVRRRGGEGGGAPHDVSWTLLGELSETCSWATPKWLVWQKQKPINGGMGAACSFTESTNMPTCTSMVWPIHDPGGIPLCYVLYPNSVSLWWRDEVMPHNHCDLGSPNGW